MAKSGRLELGGLGTTYDVHLGLIGKRVVDFLLVIELFSLGITAESLRAKRDLKSAISLQYQIFNGRTAMLSAMVTLSPFYNARQEETPRVWRWDTRASRAFHRKQASNKSRHVDLFRIAVIGQAKLSGSGQSRRDTSRLDVMLRLPTPKKTRYLVCSRCKVAFMLIQCLFAVTGVACQFRQPQLTTGLSWYLLVFYQLPVSYRYQKIYTDKHLLVYLQPLWRNRP